MLFFIINVSFAAEELLLGGTGHGGEGPPTGFLHYDSDTEADETNPGPSPKGRGVDKPQGEGNPPPCGRPIREGDSEIRKDGQGDKEGSGASTAHVITQEEFDDILSILESIDEGTFRETHEYLWIRINSLKGISHEEIKILKDSYHNMYAFCDIESDVEVDRYKTDNLWKLSQDQLREYKQILVEQYRAIEGQGDTEAMGATRQGLADLISNVDKLIHQKTISKGMHLTRHNGCYFLWDGNLFMLFRVSDFGQGRRPGVAETEAGENNCLFAAIVGSKPALVPIIQDMSPPPKAAGGLADLSLKNFLRIPARLAADNLIKFLGRKSCDEMVEPYAENWGRFVEEKIYPNMDLRLAAMGLPVDYNVDLSGGIMNASLQPLRLALFNMILLKLDTKFDIVQPDGTVVSLTVRQILQERVGWAGYTTDDAIRSRLCEVYFRGLMLEDGFAILIALLYGQPICILYNDGKDRIVGFNVSQDYYGASGLADKESVTILNKANLHYVAAFPVAAGDESESAPPLEAAEA